jgi:hypothetical protein
MQLPLSTNTLIWKCSHAGPDCKGPLQTEHLIYGKDERKTFLCKFHHQTVQQIRRLLALRKRELRLRATNAKEFIVTKKCGDGGLPEDFPKRCIASAK